MFQKTDPEVYEEFQEKKYKMHLSTLENGHEKNNEKMYAIIKRQQLSKNMFADCHY